MNNNKQTLPKLQRSPASWRLAAYILMLLFTVLTVFPLVWLFYSSLKPHAEIMLHPMALPRSPSLDN
jgi:raffinose/stachyose/melibiose transport system permease protein